MSVRPEPRGGIEAPVVVGLGELLWDDAPDGRRWGGAPANFACYAAQFGAQAWTVSAVGADEAGVSLVSCAQAHGVQTCVAKCPDRSTGRVGVILGDDGVPTYRIDEDSAWDHIPWSRAASALAGRVDIVCFGSLAQRHPDSRGTIHRFLAAAPAHALRVFDVNLRAPYVDSEVVRASIANADVLKVNEQEWQEVSRWFRVDVDFAEGGRALRDRCGLRWVVRTLGERGSEAVGPEGFYAAPARPVAPVDTVGAGDAYTATLALGLWRGVRPRRLLELSSEVSACVCTLPGGAQALPARLLGELRRELMTG